MKWLNYTFSNTLDVFDNAYKNIKYKKSKISC